MSSSCKSLISVKKIKNHLGYSFNQNNIEHLYHAFMYSPVLLLSGIYPVPAMHSLLVISDVRNIGCSWAE